MSKHHRTVDRVTGIIELTVASPNGTTLSDLTEVLQAAKSSIHSLVQGLQAAGYIDERSGRLYPGPAVQALTGHLRVPGLVRSSRQRLEEVAQATGETTMLGTRVSDAIIYVAEATSHHDIRYVPRLLDSRPLFSTALGQVFLAELPPQDVTALAARLQPDLEGDLNQFLQVLEGVRERGVAFNLGRTVPSLYAAAALIRDQTGSAIAGITVAGPRERMESKLSEVAGLVADCASDLAIR